MACSIVVYNINSKVDWKYCDDNELNVCKDGVIDLEFSDKLRKLKQIKLSYY